MFDSFVFDIIGVTEGTTVDMLLDENVQIKKESELEV